MINQQNSRYRNRMILAMGMLVIATFGLLSVQPESNFLLLRRSDPAARPGGQGPRLVSVQPLPEMTGAICEWEPASASLSFIETLQQQQAEARSLAPAPTVDEKAAVNARKPVRMIRDAYSAYSSVGVDLKNDEVIMTDESLFNILAYNRTENTPPTATMSEPKRMIGGLDTYIEYQCAVYIDQTNGDIYAVNNDTVDRLVIFSREQKGNVAPHRIIRTPHTTYGIAVDEPHQELFLTVQEAAAVSVFNKAANEDDPPIRLLQGDKTLLADPHGIAIDSNRDLMFVANFGQVAQHRPPPADNTDFGSSEKPNWPIGRAGAVPGTGKFTDTSITVYPRDASGDVAPIRVITGSRTQLNWPTALAVDPKRGDLYVANDTGDSVLVFDVNASGNVAPKRVIKGSKSMVKSPTGIFFDWEHDELWVSNFGNHTATVYPATASGDAAPLRVVRSAPLDAGTPNIGNAYAPAYDSKRDQIIVPN
jgi:DNA-binding beta-propeller fold protein YncE